MGNGRTEINARSSINKQNEEQKSKTFGTSNIRSTIHQPTSFGDNYNRSRPFLKSDRPEEEKEIIGKNDKMDRQISLENQELFK